MLNFQSESHTNIFREYGANEILIKVEVAGSNPKDWKHAMPNYFNSKINQGDDCAGTVAAVGSAVRGFKQGDRVAGFHQMKTPRGTYAEYTVCPAHTVFPIPNSMSYEEASTIPLTGKPLDHVRHTIANKTTAYTAAVGLYRNLALPLPFSRPDLDPVPLIINGAAGAVGAYALQLAASNPSISPIIAIAGANGAYVKDLGATITLDYRSPNIAAELAEALKTAKNPDKVVALDCVNTDASVKYLTSVLDPKKNRYTCTSGIVPSQKAVLEAWGGWFQQIWVGSIHEDNPAGGIMFGAAISMILETLIAQGKFKGQPYELVPGGLNGVKAALIQLRDRKGGNTKFVTRIADTA
jgi:NADPH:quinone reductase